MDNFKILTDKADKILKLLEVLSDISTGMLPWKDVLTIQEASEYSGLSISTLYHESSRGLITSSKKGKKLFFPIMPFIDWYIESYFQNSVRRKKMDLASGSAKSCTPIRNGSLKRYRQSDIESLGEEINKKVK